MKVFVAVGCLLAVTAFAGGKKKAKPPPPPPAPLTAPSAKLSDAMGGKVAELMVAATKIEVARTSYTQGIRPDPAKAIGSDFQREGAWKELTPKDVEALRQIVYSDKSFNLKANVAGCSFEPSVVFQLTAGGLDTQHMLLSFKCNQVLFFTVKPGGRAVPGVALDVKPARKKLLELVKALLPQDSALQAIN